ncbi:sac3 ganp family protein [Cystoisospora suis]|uniref:Eukaryotic translation initiation factor 3 subunit K n=1 Tax=Cystoisospora suis TaxID=483139 RepID=A0A2C6KI37_9APIC|nr:sac3 ganp family protein [Cystoisospora suis]
MAAVGGGTSTSEPLSVQVHALLDSPFRYDPSSLTLLCQYTEEQVAKNTYDREACLAVLKLYLLYPQCFSVDLARKIIVKGIMNLPNEDCAVFVGMLQQQPGKKEWKRVQEAIQLWEMLEKCSFKQVWEYLREPFMSDIASTPGLTEAIRRFVCDVIALTYHTLSFSDFSLFVNASQHSHEAEKLLRTCGWTLEDFNINAKESGKPKEIIKIVRVTGPAALAAAALKEGEGGSSGVGSLGGRGGVGGQVRGVGSGQAAQALAVRKTVEKYMTPDNLKMCMATLLK